MLLLRSPASVASFVHRANTRAEYRERIPPYRRLGSTGRTSVSVLSGVLSKADVVSML